ncbi:hypothetical protein HDU79_002073, partial [Rhizoclosmatium sp. JEL0117]
MKITCCDKCRRHGTKSVTLMNIVGKFHEFAKENGTSNVTELSEIYRRVYHQTCNGGIVQLSLRAQIAAIGGVLPSLKPAPQRHELPVEFFSGFVERGTLTSNGPCMNFTAERNSDVNHVFIGSLLGEGTFRICNKVTTDFQWKAEDQF